MRRPGRKGANHRPGRRLPMGRADRGRLDAIRLRRDCLMRFESRRKCLPMVKPTGRGKASPRGRLPACLGYGHERTKSSTDARNTSHDVRHVDESKFAAASTSCHGWTIFRDSRNAWLNACRSLLIHPTSAATSTRFCRVQRCSGSCFSFPSLSFCFGAAGDRCAVSIERVARASRSASKMLPIRIIAAV
jgi:hypothetical protein